MTRLVHLLALAASCAAMAVAGAGFLETVREELSPAPGGETAPAAVAAVAPAASPLVDDLPPFGPIFGEIQGTPVPAEAGRAPRFDYVLAGTFASEGVPWAILSGASGDIVVGEGDAVGTRAWITRILADRVDVEHGQNSMTLRFRDAAAAGPAPDPGERSAESGLVQARAPEAAAPYAQMVKSVTMSRADVLTLVAEAKARPRPAD